MRHFYLLAFVLLGSFTLITGCKKDDTTPDTKSVLTSGSWKLTSWTSDPAFPNGSGATIPDLYNQLPSCTKDDLSVFNANGTYNEDEGASKCNPADPQVFNQGTWTLSVDNKTLNITAGGRTTENTLVSVSSSEIKATFNLSDGASSTKYKQSVTYVKQ
jgi:hypothetical protein